MSPGVYTAQANGTWTAPRRPTIPAGDRSALVWGTYVPTPTNAGLLPSVQLTPYNDDVVVTTDRAIVENLDIKGRVIVKARDVRVRNCRVRGKGPMTNGVGLIDTASYNSVVGGRTIVEDCLLIPDYPSVYWNAFIGTNITVRRCHWQWVVDGGGGFSTQDPSAPLNWLIEQNYGGPLSFFSPDPNHANTDDRVHADHFQIQSGQGTDANPSVIIRGNALHGWYAGGVVFPERWPGFDPSVSDPMSDPPNAKLNADLRDACTSLLQVTPNLGVPVTGIRFERNYCFGGGVGVSLAGGAGSGKRNPGVFIDNVFDGQQRQGFNQGSSNAWCFSIKSPEYGDRNTPELLGTYSGNINTATGGPARLGRVTA